MLVQGPHIQTHYDTGKLGGARITNGNARRRGDTMSNSTQIGVTCALVEALVSLVV